MNFDDGETGAQGADGGGGEIADYFFNSLLVERGGRRVVGGREGDGAGSNGLPAAFGCGEERAGSPRHARAGFASGVGELNAGERALGAEESGDARKEFDVVVFVDSEILRGDAAFGGDGAGFGEDEGGAADGARAEMNEVPIVGETVGAGILAHRGNHDAVAKFCVANLEWVEDVHW